MMALNRPKKIEGQEKDKILGKIAHNLKNRSVTECMCQIAKSMREQRSFQVLSNKP